MAGERLSKALRAYRRRYAGATLRKERTEILDEFCKVSGYRRKHPIALLGRPQPDDGNAPAGRIAWASKERQRHRPRGASARYGNYLIAARGVA